MSAGVLVLVNLLGLAFTIYGIVRSGERAQVLIYAFILTYLVQLLTMEVLLRTNARVVSFLSRPPERGRESNPVTVQGTGQPVGLGGYLLVMAILSFFAFILANVNAARALELDLATFASDVGWGWYVTGIYWAQGLISRTLVLDVRASRAVNYGYNTRELTVLAFAVLFGGVVVAIRQSFGHGASGWVVLGPLLAMRQIYDLALALTLGRVRAARSPAPAPRPLDRQRR